MFSGIIMTTREFVRGGVTMNRKRLALLTGLTLFAGGTATVNHLVIKPETADVKAAQLKDSLKPTKKYPNIKKELDLTSMEQYTSDNLFMNVTLNKFYIKDVGFKDDEYTLLLAPIKSSRQYFLITTKSSQPIKKNHKITVQGFLNGKSKISVKEIDAGINKRYLHKKIVTMLPDNFTLY